MRVNRLTGIKTFVGFVPKISSSAADQPDGLLRHETVIYSVFPTSVITSKAANDYQFKTGQRREPVRDQFVLPCRLLWKQVGFGAPASRTALEHVSMVQ